jgi:hypothetical protein
MGSVAQPGPFHSAVLFTVVALDEGVTLKLTLMVTPAPTFRKSHVITPAALLTVQVAGEMPVGQTAEPTSVVLAGTVS